MARGKKITVFSNRNFIYFCSNLYKLWKSPKVDDKSSENNVNFLTIPMLCHNERF